LITIGECTELHQHFEDINKEDDLNIIGQGCDDVMSDGQQDTSLLMLEKEWLESQK
jgi:hypothetical protein